MHSFCLFLHYSFFTNICSLTTCCTRTLWYGQYARGSSTPQYDVRSPNTFTSAAPRTYSIICIGSESCLGSNVGFARLLCFGTLRSVISAKVALGEPLRLCPGWAGLNTSVEKAKTDCHDEARDRSLFERFFESLKTYAASSEELDNPSQGVDSAPNSVFQTRGFAEI